LHGGESLGYFDRVEPETRTRSVSKWAGSELLGVLVDPAPVDAPPFGHDLRGDHPFRPFRLGRLEQVGKATGERFDRFGGERDLLRLS
jgi:hypothetical protein